MPSSPIATFCCSGSTCGPSLVSICLRCGWSLGGIQDRYLRYEAAGDQYLGRLVCGLPQDSHKFAVLPPHFSDEGTELIQDTLERTFPSLVKLSHLRSLLLLCLASLVYQHVYLQQTLHASHPLFFTPLFSSPSNLSDLYKTVSFGYTSPKIVATGIPPHISILKSLHRLDVTVTSLPTRISSDLDAMLESKGAKAGNISKELLVSIINDALKSVQTPAKQRESQAERSLPQDTKKRVVFVWKDGSEHFVPEDFTFPSVDVSTAWYLWFRGNGSVNYPPFRHISPTDISDKNQRKRICDWRFLMNALYEAGLEHDIFTEESISQMTETELIQCCERVFSKIDIPFYTETGRKRRRVQIRVQTAVNILRRERGRVDD